MRWPARHLAREPPRTPLPDQARILVAPDIFDPAFAAHAVRGADVVVSAVGPNFATHHNPRTAMTSPPDLHLRLVRTLITALRDSAPPAGLICVSTASMGPADAIMGPAPRLLFRFFRTVAVPNLGRGSRDRRGPFHPASAYRQLVAGMPIIWIAHEWRADQDSGLSSQRDPG
ncbi:MAG TPA: hypothetical protein VGS06_13680, partial [Streptosporangiaceae bacterium]|nr:hypothetical protein [Streptosporangiaceae bacterium]